MVAGLDPAFSGYDLFGLAVLARSTVDRRRLVLAHVDGLRPRASASVDDRATVTRELLDHVAGVCTRWSAEAVTDQYAARQVAHT